jgi:hypothetical protein
MPGTMNVPSARDRGRDALPDAGALTIRFADLRRDDIDVAGGKGSNLGEMKAADLPVPDGFVVTVIAFRRFLEESGVGSRIREELDRLDVDDTGALQRTADTIRELVLGGRAFVRNGRGFGAVLVRRHVRELPERAGRR